MEAIAASVHLVEVVVGARQLPHLLAQLIVVALDVSLLLLLLLLLLMQTLSLLLMLLQCLFLSRKLLAQLLLRRARVTCQAAAPSIDVTATARPPQPKWKQRKLGRMREQARPDLIS